MLYVVSFCNYGLIYFISVVIASWFPLLWFPCFLVFLVYHSKYNDDNKGDDTSCHPSWNWWSNDDHIIRRGWRRARRTAVFWENTVIRVHRMTEELNGVKDTTVNVWNVLLHCTRLEEDNFYSLILKLFTFAISLIALHCHMHITVAATVIGK